MQKASPRKKGEMRLTEEIYGDVLFIINFSMDFLSLYIVGRLLHLDMKAWRVILGASIGALYGVLELLIDTYRFFEMLLTVSILFLMCLIAFGIKRARTYFTSVVLVGGVGMLIGGMMTSAFVRLGSYPSYIEIGGDIHTVFGDIPVWKFAVFALLSALATWGIGRLFKRKSALRTCRLRITFGGEEKELTALVDSGNLSEEPLSGTPVIFLKRSAAAVLPERLIFAMQSGISALSAEDAGKLRVIPSRTVTGDGLILAAVPEKTALFSDGIWENRRALIALDISDGDYGGFEALVPEILF